MGELSKKREKFQEVKNTIATLKKAYKELNTHAINLSR